jgi:hypothetical protein
MKNHLIQSPSVGVSTDAAIAAVNCDNIANLSTHDFSSSFASLQRSL